MKSLRNSCYWNNEAGVGVKADMEMVDRTTHCVRLTANTALFTARHDAIDADMAQTLSGREAAQV
jgi:hypothetical protein